MAARSTSSRNTLNNMAARSTSSRNTLTNMAARSTSSRNTLNNMAARSTSSRNTLNNMAARSTSDLTRGITEFSLGLYKLFADGDENIFMSPYSVTACLLLADLGANGSTEEQIRYALGVRELDKDAVHKLYQQLQERLNAETKGTTTLAVANRMFSKLGLVVDEKYINNSKQLYGSELQQMDFGGDPEGSRQTINKWVEEQTRNKITDLVPPGCINALSLMILVNAIYFKGSWDEPFHAEETSKTMFRVSKDDQKMVDMMHDTRDCNYLKDEKLRLSAVSLPYQSNNLSMIFILPDEVDGLSNLERTLTGVTLGSLCRDVVQSGKLEVIIGIPKFKMEARYDLTRALPRLGISDMFKLGAADFSAMLPANSDAHVSDVIHKAFVEVNEEGTEATAATGMMIQCFSMPMSPEKFILDHPFLFIIWDHSSSTVIFIGRYVKPPN